MESNQSNLMMGMDIPVSSPEINAAFPLIMDECLVEEMTIDCICGVY